MDDIVYIYLYLKLHPTRQIFLKYVYVPIAIKGLTNFKILRKGAIFFLNEELKSANKTRALTAQRLQERSFFDMIRLVFASLVRNSWSFFPSPLCTNYVAPSNILLNYI